MLTYSGAQKCFSFSSYLHFQISTQKAFRHSLSNTDLTHGGICRVTVRTAIQTGSEMVQAGDRWLQSSDLELMHSFIMKGIFDVCPWTLRNFAGDSLGRKRRTHSPLCPSSISLLPLPLSPSPFLPSAMQMGSLVPLPVSEGFSYCS